MKYFVTKFDLKNMIIYAKINWSWYLKIMDYGVRPFKLFELCKVIAIDYENEEATVELKQTGKINKETVFTTNYKISFDELEFVCYFKDKTIDEAYGDFEVIDIDENNVVKKEGVFDV